MDPFTPSGNGSSHTIWEWILSHHLEMDPFTPSGNGSFHTICFNPLLCTAHSLRGFSAPPTLLDGFRVEGSGLDWLDGIHGRLDGSVGCLMVCSMGSCQSCLAIVSRTGSKPVLDLRLTHGDPSPLHFHHPFPMAQPAPPVLLPHYHHHHLPAGTAGLGLSLVQIHIYMAPIKRALQALWAVGAAGTVGIMLMQFQGLLADPIARLARLLGQQCGELRRVGHCHTCLGIAHLFGPRLRASE
eukprot:358600-Chlamydomonas_euryale.AAC.1